MFILLLSHAFLLVPIKQSGNEHVNKDMDSIAIIHIGIYLYQNAQLNSDFSCT
mgnify:FL=1